MDSEPVDLNEHRGNAWADGLIVKLEEIVLKQGGEIKWIDKLSGDPIVVAITPVIVEFIKENRAALSAVTLEDFKSFLNLLCNDQTVDALQVIYDRMDTEALLEKYKQNADALNDLVVQQAEQKKFWVSLAEQLAIKLLPAGIGLLL